MNAREDFLTRRFYDDSRFPYGFSRSGDFTIAEAEALERCGSLYQAVTEGRVSNPNDDDIRITQVITGEVEASSVEERAWFKYFKSHRRMPIWLIDREKTVVSSLSQYVDEEADMDSDIEELLVGEIS